MTSEMLPIGSVVQLQDSESLAMIIGYLPVTPTRPGYVWDYSGVRFPIGYTDDDLIFCFDREQIVTVYAHGYMDIEEEIFMSRLNEVRGTIADAVASGELGPEDASSEEEDK